MCSDIKTLAISRVPGRTITLHLRQIHRLTYTCQGSSEACVSHTQSSVQEKQSVRPMCKRYCGGVNWRKIIQDNGLSPEHIFHLTCLKNN